MTRSPFRRPVAAVALVASTLLPPSLAQATTLYASSFEGQSLWKVDTVALTATQIYNTAPAGNSPDSLIFDSAGRILYSAHLPGRVQRLDLSANTDTTLDSWSGHPTDLALDPGGNSVLVSDYIDPNLRRVSLTGGPTTVLASGSYYSGLAYVGSRLFANAGPNPNNGGTQLLELSPTSGATLASTPSNSSGDLDGLVYDAFTGHLFATDLSAGTLNEFDPNNLATAAIVHPLPMASLMPDGLCSDGLGHLWYASRSNYTVYQYDISTGASTPLVQINGLDDLAPASGLGSMPEPALALLAPLLLLRRRRNVR